MIQCPKREETPTSQQWRWTRAACHSPRRFGRLCPLHLVRFGLARFALSRFAVLRLVGRSRGPSWIQTGRGGAGRAHPWPSLCHAKAAAALLSVGLVPARHCPFPLSELLERSRSGFSSVFSLAVWSCLWKRARSVILTLFFLTMFCMRTALAKRTTTKKN